MKKIALLLAIVFSLTMFASPSFADWTKVSEDVKGNTQYVDFDRIRKHGGYVYYWVLGDYLKPTNQGHLSAKVYHQGDCKLFRSNILNDSFHTQPMGKGTPSSSSNKPDEEWDYPSPDSIGEYILKRICAYEN